MTSFRMGRWARAHAARELALKPLQGIDVVLDCAQVRLTSATDADEIVRTSLVERGAARLILVHADHPGAVTLVAELIKAAETYGVRAQLVIPAPALVPALALVS